MRAQLMYCCPKCEHPYVHLEDAETCCPPVEVFMCSKCQRTFSGDGAGRKEANACCKAKQSARLKARTKSLRSAR